MTSSALVSAYAGYYWWLDTQNGTGDPLNGLALMGLGLVIFLAISGVNIAKTNILYGVSGTALQLLVFSI